MAQGTFRQMNPEGEKRVRASQTSNRTAASTRHDLFDAARCYLIGRRGALVLSIVAMLAGLGLSWNWLVAAGIAPSLVPALPCLAMCGLGLCMNRLVGNSCATQLTPIGPAQLTHSLTQALWGRSGCGSPAISSETSSIKSRQVD
jgi:hypothetical protein